MHSPFVIVVTAEYAGPKVVSILVWNIDRMNVSVSVQHSLKACYFSWTGNYIYEHSLYAFFSFICGYCDFSGEKVSNFPSEHQKQPQPLPSAHGTHTYPVSVFWSSDVWCATGETIEASVLVWAHNLDQHLLVMGSLLCGRKKTERQLGSLYIFQAQGTLSSSMKSKYLPKLTWAGIFRSKWQGQSQAPSNHSWEKHSAFSKKSSIF